MQHTCTQGKASVKKENNQKGRDVMWRHLGAVCDEHGSEVVEGRGVGCVVQFPNVHGVFDLSSAVHG